VAVLRKINNLSELQTLNGKSIFIGYYQPSVQNNSWFGGSLSVMSLADSDKGTNGLFASNDMIKTPSSPQSFLSQNDYDKLVENLRKNPIANAEILGKIDDSDVDIQILDLGSANNLYDLQSKFKIDVVYNNKGTETLDDDVYNFSGVDANKYDLGLLKFSGVNALVPFTYYTIWSGHENSWPNLGGLVWNQKFVFETDAKLSCNETAGTFQISYTIDSTQRYINFDSVNKNFVGANPNNGTPTTSNLCIYVVEMMDTIPLDSATYVPKAGSTSLTFAADQFILWPSVVMSQNGSYKTNGTTVNMSTATLLSNSNNNTTNGTYHNASQEKSDGGGGTEALYKTYKLIGINQLAGAGWQNGKGQPLTKEYLSKKFTMQNAIRFGVSLQLGSWNGQVNDNSVMAPVGVTGANANIPKGSIAFRINKDGESTIRVIVSVPVSQFYDESNSTNKLSTSVDYYLGLWKTEDISEGGGITLNSFNQASAEQKFELPRSRPYSLGSTADGSDYILIEYSGQTYRCYLNGERILVGYEFTVAEKGTYILGTAAGITPIESIFGGGGEDTSVDYPMEIVYCSADGTASPGNDGTAGSVYGSIDYVYDFNNKIVNVQDYASNVEANTYDYYFNSHCVTYTDNKASGFPNIGQLQVYVRRSIVDGKSTLTIYANGTNKALLLCKTSGIDPDNVDIKREAPPSSSS
jgi:hypothetical protein